MEANERRELIERRIVSDGEATLKFLALEFGVSEMTVRRDLEFLEGRGVIRRVLGGAIAGQGVAVEPGADQRAQLEVREKINVAVAAVEQLSPGQTVILDSGLTALAVARTIVGRGLGLTVLTPSVLVALELHNEPNTRVFVTGGTVRPGVLSLIGPESVEAFQRYNCDVYIMGVSGVDGKRGLSDYNTDEGAVKRAALQAAARVIVVADASKLGQVHLTSVAQPGEIDMLITDGPSDHPALTGLRAAGVTVECVPAM